jgi:hemerythrin superfamily protein
MADGQHSVIDILKQDHREVEQMFAELERTRGEAGDAAVQRRKDLVDQAIIELVRHSVAEEAEVYPRVKEKVSDSEAEQAKHEHAEAEETMNKLDKLQPSDPQFELLLDELIKEVREHIAEEEGEIFPNMQQVFTPDELEKMGAKVEAVKKMAPTRPHPSAPDEPPGDKLLGPVAGLFDRMRDAVTKRGTND